MNDNENIKIEVKKHGADDFELIAVKNTDVSANWEYNQRMKNEIGGQATWGRAMRPITLGLPLEAIGNYMIVNNISPREFYLNQREFLDRMLTTEPWKSWLVNPINSIRTK